MDDIDQPYRVSLAFKIVWGMLAGIGIWWGLERTDGTWYEIVVLVPVVSFLATILVFGPITLCRQIRRSGGRGLLVAGILLGFLVLSILTFFMAGNRLLRDGATIAFVLGAASVFAIRFSNSCVARDESRDLNYTDSRKPPIWVTVLILGASVISGILLCAMWYRSL